MTDTSVSERHAVDGPGVGSDARVLAAYLAVLAVVAGMLAAATSGWAAGFVAASSFGLVAAAGIVAFRRFVTSVIAEQERHRQSLFAAELDTLARLREAGQIREDLIASVSHEFRTPLTAIRGSAATLVRRYDQLGRDAQEELLIGILEHSDRLTRLLEDMLVAASASVGDPGGIADVSAAVTALDLGQSRPPVRVDADTHLAALIAPDALRRVVVALGEHLRESARRDRVVEVAAHRTADAVVASVVYTTNDRTRDLPALLDPFGGDHASVRAGRPASLALYVVRRLVEAHGGSVVVGQQGEECTVEIALRALGQRVVPVRGRAENLVPRQGGPRTPSSAVGPAR
ncbi:MAG: HAMP domain-containing histidine kinase [Actinobacteria bacterium]|nr:HAMP domain-containing histidine kinase [Actinomycetota bacterium]MBI3686295.1 HAMP domain-containing histidine kinase [Actinomycetota bacterium]